VNLNEGQTLMPLLLGEAAVGEGVRFIYGLTRGRVKGALQLLIHRYA